MRLAAWVLGLVVSAAAAAGAQEQAPNCDDPQTQMEMNLCAGMDFSQADAQLNKTYQDLLQQARAIDADVAEIEPSYVGAAEALRAAQRGWIAYRDGHCKLAGFQARGGTMESMLISSCLAELTRKRTQEMTEIREALGGQ